jgi:hypothetical protein
MKSKMTSIKNVTEGCWCFEIYHEHCCRCIPVCPASMTDCVECSSAEVCTKCSTGKYADGNTCKGKICYDMNFMDNH